MVVNVADAVSPPVFSVSSMMVGSLMSGLDVGGSSVEFIVKIHTISRVLFFEYLGTINLDCNLFQAINIDRSTGRD